MFLNGRTQIFAHTTLISITSTPAYTRQSLYAAADADQEMFNRFTLGGGDRTNNATQGGRGGDRINDATQGGRTDNSVAGSEWDNASVQLGDDPSAPIVSARLVEQIRGNRENDNDVFDLNRGIPAPNLSARFVEQIRGERENDNVFDLSRGGPAPTLSARYEEQIRGERENDNVFDLTRGGGVNQTTHLKREYLHRQCYGK